MKIAIIVIFIVALLTCAFGAALTANTVKAAPEDVKVLSYSWYTYPNTEYSDGDLIVVGEVQNIGSSTLDYVIIHGVAYSTDGQAQGATSAVAYVQNMQPQQKAPFYMDFWSDNSFSGNMSWDTMVDRVEFSITYANQTTSQQYSGLTLVYNSSSIDQSTGLFSVSATIQNTGDQVFSDIIHVVTTFYNAAGTVVALNWSAAPVVSFTSLAPGDAALYTATPEDYTQLTSQITSYSVNVEIEQKPVATTPTPGPSSPAPSSTESPGVSPTGSPSSSVQPTQSPGTQQPIPQELIYGVLAAVIIALVVVVALLLRRQGKAKSAATTT